MTEESFFGDCVTNDISSEINNLDDQLNKVLTFECNLCQASFHSKDQLLEHFSSHSSEQPFNCHICNKKFSRKYNLNKHVHCHSEESSLSETSSSCDDDLGNHLKNEKNNANERCICRICEKSYKGERNLKRHLHTHLNLPRPFVCHVCPKKFAQQKSLDAHLQIHYENIFSCEFCQKSFHFRNSLYRHLRTHAGDAPLICDLCHKAFPVKILLDSHRCVNAFSCNYCSKKFCIKGQLNIHLQTHPEEQLKTQSMKEKWQKSFKCTHCLKVFSAQIYLNCHLRTHKKEKKFICSACQKEFFNQTQFKEHLCAEVN